MRARMTLKYAGIDLEHREIELRNKPQSMLLASPKGTVPVLCVGDLVLDQSLDIIHWAISQSDPDGCGSADDVIAQAWVSKNDSPLGDMMTWVDVAIFPFIRQFSMVDAKIFEQLPIPATKKWLARHLVSELFQSVMHKHPVWRD